MFIHIFTKENVYSTGLLDLIGKHLDPTEHVFIFTRSGAKAYYEDSIRKRIIYAGNFKKFFLSFSPLFRKCSQVFFHYLPAGPSLAVWSVSPLILKKSTWIIWGGDIYPLTTYNRSSLSRFYEFLRKKMIKQIRHIAAFVREDYEIVCKTYGTDASYSQILYPIPIRADMLKPYRTKSDPHDCTTILLGNSASKTNNHLSALEMLSYFRERNIEILCPLAYGSEPEYTELVKSKGSELFGGKFVPITSFMKPEEYSLFISKVDIAVMNHNRQQGLGNILPVMYMGKKVYLRKETSSYRFLIRQGCTIFAIEELQINPESIFEDKESDLKRNTEIVGNIISEENYMKLWGSLFHRFDQR